MRTLTKFTSPFAPLHLAAEDEAQLEHVAAFFVRKAVAQYDRFLLQGQEAVDPDEWRLLKRKEGVRVYAQRRPKDASRRRARALKRHQSERLSVKRLSSCLFGGAAGLFGGGRPDASTCGTGSRSSCLTATGAASLSSHDSSPPADVAGVPEAASVEMPVLLAVGSIPGTLEDAMYGSVAPTVEAMRVRTQYTGDHVEDAAVLATVTAPSASDPFRSLSVKWIQQDFPLAVRSVLRRRDLVCLEATGTTTTAAGETVGYHLRHSVHFPQTHQLAGVVRGDVSHCTLFRPQRRPRGGERAAGPACVDVFARCCLNPSEGLVRAVVMNAAALEMAASGAVVHCARMKKLAWVALRRHSAASLDALLGSKAGAGVSARRSRRDDSCCVTCKRRAGPGLRLLGLSERASCKICGRVVCAACKMKKTLLAAPADGEVLRQQDATLCNVCVHTSMVRASALEVAREEVAEREQQRLRCVESPLVRTGRDRSRGRAAPSRCGELSNDTSFIASRALAGAPPGVISSSVAMDMTREFYGELQAERW